MDLSQFKDVFLGEANDILARIENMLVDLDKSPDDIEKIRSVFRDFHTLKGNAGTMGLEKLAQLAHAVEDLLEKPAQGQQPLGAQALQGIIDTLDSVRVLLGEFRDGIDRGFDLAPALARLNAVGALRDDAASREAAVYAPIPGSTAVAIKPRTVYPSNVRVGLRKLDNIMNMVEELTVVKARLLVQAAALKSGALKEEIVIFDRLVKRLQQETLETRLISVADIFQGYRRVVRDTARALGKDVDFIVEESDTSIDRVLLEKINEPLVHLLRNAVDHGLENSSTRAACGKPAAGKVILRARREQGFAVVEVVDDGQGLDAAAIKKKAVALGILTQSAADGMSDDVARYMACLPNFSTREKATETSGRGVGMDVVQTVMNSVNGRLEIESTPGKGTRIALHLPLNLAIIQALMLKAGGQVFAAPLSDVLEIVSFENVITADIEGKPVIHLRGEVIPVLDLAARFELPAPAVPGAYGAIVRTVRGKLALRVEAMLGRHEIVIKNFESYLKRVAGINSATILGDGRVVLILDLRGLK